MTREDQEIEAAISEANDLRRAVWAAPSGSPLVRWVREEQLSCWELIVQSAHRSAATVWDNGTWHTWDRDGVGGENSSEETVDRAKIEAAASAIAQGFI